MQELKFKIKGTETANVEIIPVSDGVEIVVHYGAETQQNNGSFENKPKKTYTYHNNQDKSNIEILKEFCGGLRKSGAASVDEILKFYNFYEGKLEDWKGVMQPEKLWQRWKETSINK